MSELSITQILKNHGFPADRLTEFKNRFLQADSESPRTGMTPMKLWQEISQTFLSPKDPHDLHIAIWQWVFSQWDSSTQGPRPAWIPTEKDIKRANISYAVKKLRSQGVQSISSSDYFSLQEWSHQNAELFWAFTTTELGIAFDQPPEKWFGKTWLEGAQLNIAESCFQSDPDSLALIYQREGESQASIRWTYADLEKKSNEVTQSILSLGIPKGTAIAIDMLMNHEAVAIYLGIIKAGCVVVSIADSFAPDEIATRLRIAKAEWIFCHDVIRRGGKTLPLYEKVIAANTSRAVVIPFGSTLEGPPLRSGDLHWEDFLKNKSRPLQKISCRPQDPINILFSSGTTGDPKAIPWTHVTPIKAASDGFYHHDIHPEDCVAWPTNLGWMMGPWLIFATLINHGTIALFGGAPHTREFGLFVQENGVNVLGVIPSIVKAWQSSRCMEGLDWSAIKLFSSTGECSNADDMFYLMRLAGYKPVIEYCGGTEIGGGYITGTVVQAASPATFTTAALGITFHIIDGELFLVPPSMGLSESLLNRDHDEVYYKDTPLGPQGEKLRRHGDEIEKLPGGFYRALGRVDDTMNLGGIKVSSAEIERTLATIEGIEETAAIAITPPGGGPSLLVVYVVTKKSLQRETILKECQSQIRTKLNPLFKIHDLVITEKLPRTASNKVMRRELRKDYEAKISPHK